ncbi:hypothetical protein SAMN02745181_3254 [Rubritalea squalenifaciens DSM 18772]|uniref:Uncharacterized protein n=1 Tax=Rubritalea squalenifaciens DSM 18772 TaxID=1123071 RepID=A0A1M6PPH7_9BACT|nr:DUF5690 family protein [Rubritalea squalenifaciens]SHK09830.1 hypothetical protein SAMN02745181_3254 [Rubritalea squalenifaciens DSM 18772]
MSTQDPPRQGRLKSYLTTTSQTAFTAYAAMAAFLTYFAMYAFRKPYAAAAFEGQTWFGGEVGLKAALAASQLLGYAASKIIGIKVCSELDHRKRGIFLFGVIAVAELSLLIYGILPNDWKVLPIAVNGLALGVVWGVVVTYLEGRRTSEVLLAGLSCSFIMASGIVKDFGKAVIAGSDAAWWHGVPLLSPKLVQLTGPVSEGWMPFVVGLHYLPIFAIAVFLLKQIPDPDEKDVAERSERKVMMGNERMVFLKQFALGLFLLCAAYLLLTAYRDFRDTYQVDIFRLMGYEDSKENQSLLGTSETIVAFAVTLGLGLLYWLRKVMHRGGLLLVWLFMLVGLAVLGGGTWLYQAGLITGFSWMVMTGVGVYMTYVPFGSVLFDQIIASTRFQGTAVFAIYVCDGVGYVGAVSLYFLRGSLFGDMDKLVFFREFTWLMTMIGVVCLVSSYWYFGRKAKIAKECEAHLERA